MQWTPIVLLMGATFLSFIYTTQGLECNLECPNGKRVDLYDCEICECKSVSKCPPINCSCQENFKWSTDSDGCKVCPCVPECKQITCTKNCTYGLASDENKCPQCECKSYPTCGPPQCTLNCTNGYKGVDGMQTCNCCPQVSCAMACSTGFARDQDGCQKCECAPSTVRPMTSTVSPMMSTVSSVLVKTKQMNKIYLFVIIALSILLFLALLVICYCRYTVLRMYKAPK